MLLEKSDLEQIEKIVEKSAESTKKELRQEIEKTVAKSENRLNKKIEETVESSEKRVMEAVESSEKRVMSVINREVGDLAEINHAVIDKVDRIDILEKRLTRVEHKVGIVG